MWMPNAGSTGMDADNYHRASALKRCWSSVTGGRAMRSPISSSSACGAGLLDVESGWHPCTHTSRTSFLSHASVTAGLFAGSCRARKNCRVFSNNTIILFYLKYSSIVSLLRLSGTRRPLISLNQPRILHTCTDTTPQLQPTLLPTAFSKTAISQA